MGGKLARRRAALATLAGLVLLVAPGRYAAAAGGKPQAQVRVARESFWYQADDASGAGVDGDDETFVPECVDRIVDAVDAVLRLYPDSFPQPPPLSIVVRAVTREQIRTPLWSRSVGSYGCAELVDGVVVIEIAPSTCVGRDALDDAELRSLLGHELVHAYQFARRGDHHHDADAIARREIEALEWEIAHAEPTVRPWYRDDVQFNLKMYRAMLPE